MKESNFRNRYMKSEMKFDDEETFMRTVIGHGLERDDLRDEIYVMCKNFFIYLK